MVPFDLGVPCQVFGWGRADLGEIRYQAVVCSDGGRPVRAATGFELATRVGLEAVAHADTVVVAGIADVDTPIPEAVCDALRGARARGARIASICTGAFVLGAAGLLDGRHAATHWEDAPALAARYPQATVDADVLYADAGPVLTSAGIAAGIDLCLHMVRSDYGAEVANAVARRMVASPHRSGGQAQFVPIPVPPPRSAGLEGTRTWMLGQLAGRLTIDGMADHACMSPRTFLRRFRAETGTTPYRWLLRQRVLLAQRLLETSDASVERIAAQAGFGSATGLRTHFRRVLRTSPRAYRLAFRAA